MSAGDDGVAVDLSHFGSRGPQGVVGRRGWRPRTTVGFAEPGKSIAGGNVTTSAGPPLVDGACCTSPLRTDGLVRWRLRRWWW